MRLTISSNLLFLILWMCANGNGKLKCSSKSENCRWFGSCNGTNIAISCPPGYTQQEELSCMSRIHLSKYFCCKDGVNYTGQRTAYLHPGDYRNAITFPPIISNNIPLPHVIYSNSTRNAVKYENPWPGARAAYTLDKSFSDEDRAEVVKAINNYHENTCFHFYPKDDKEDKNWISIEGDDKTDTGHNCGQSQLCGPAGGGQYSKFGGSCRNAEWMIHELGHSICFNHEQDRFDRDEYIYFDTKNVEGCTESQKATEENSVTSGLPFDFKSSQMYPGCRKGNCIQRKNGKEPCGNKWDGTGVLSPLDIKKINKYYNCCKKDPKYEC